MVEKTETSEGASNEAEVDRLRAELAATQEELRRASAELESFAYTASHDLQEPLRMVTNYLSLLERRYAEALDDRAREYIRFAVDGASRMQRLIRDLLAFSRAGRDREPEEVVPLDDALASALRTLAPRIAEASAEIAADPLPKVFGHRSQLVTLFENLVGNALQYRGEGPAQVRITAESGPAEWAFRIADRGMGIEPQFRDAVFEPFRRLHPRDVLPGTGLGLSIARKIVERYGGRISAESPAEGPGVVLRFTLPASRIRA